MNVAVGSQSESLTPPFIIKTSNIIFQNKFPGNSYWGNPIVTRGAAVYVLLSEPRDIFYLNSDEVGQRAK